MRSMEQVKQVQPVSKPLGWGIALGLSVALATVFAAYIYIAYGTITTLESLTMLAASVSAFLFAFAFGSSSLSYYTGFPDMRRLYQKYIGIMAFWVALIYSLMLLAYDPDFYLYGFFDNFFTADISLGISAMIIFGAMVVINTAWIGPIVGKEVIKFTLSFGLIGYALLVIRAIWIEWDVWALWFETFEGPIPGRIILSVLGTSILLARVSIPLHQKFIKKRSR